MDDFIYAYNLIAEGLTALDEYAEEEDLNENQISDLTMVVYRLQKVIHSQTP